MAIQKVITLKPKASDPASMIRRYRFAKKYVELGLNATRAYLTVYGDAYKINRGKDMSNATAQSSSARMLTNIHVQRYIEQFSNEAL